jgi:hypothetical protein
MDVTEVLDLSCESSGHTPPYFDGELIDETGVSRADEFGVPMLGRLLVRGQRRTSQHRRPVRRGST